MEKVSSILKKLFYGILAVALLIVIVFETGLLTPGSLGGDKAAEFPILTAMELLTVCLIPFSLYLFRVKSVRQNLLAAPAQSMLTWGFVRMAMLAFLLVVNVVCYYLYMNASFGYMAIIAAISMLFIYPSIGRCKEEASSNVEENDNENDNPKLP
ncbi:MAG: hypothetical protein J6M37_02635 [Prevotella sp.]|nr:hypothetical protein [Prevotella sp.]